MDDRQRLAVSKNRVAILGWPPVRVEVGDAGGASGRGSGFGTGLALGIQVANPDRRVVCITGDGAVGFTIAEFDTMVRHNLPIVTVVMNNRGWGATQRFQDLISGPGKNIAVALGGARYDKVA